MKINEWPRHGIQALWAFITNSHVTGFVTGKIYTGKLKNACVPGLNCYSCPGAVGACPIGSLQAVIGSWNFKMAYYVVGFLIFIGAMVPCFRFLVNEPNACRNASFSGHGAFRRGRKWLCRARIRKLCKKSSPGTWRRVIDEGRGAFIHGGIAAWTAAGRRGFFPLG